MTATGCTEFSITDTATWPVVLNDVQVAAIYQRPVLGLRKAIQRGTFTPAPYKVKPYRWRKVDILRDVEGARGLRRVS